MALVMALDLTIDTDFGGNNGGNDFGNTLNYRQFNSISCVRADFGGSCYFMPRFLVVWLDFCPQ